MKKKSLLHILIATSIVSTGLVTGTHQVEAAAPGHVADQTIPEGQPKTVGELKNRMEQMKQKMEAKYKKKVNKVVVTTINDGKYTIELDGTYKKHRDKDSLNGRLRTAEFTFTDNTTKTAIKTGHTKWKL